MRKKQKLVAKENSEVELWQPQENPLKIKLRKQKAQGRLCDVIFVHGDVKIYSHASVLASYSPYMMELLFKDTSMHRNDWCIKRPLMLNLTAVLKQPEHVCYECFKNVIDYMYTDQIDMHKCHPKHVEFAANSLRMAKLIRICNQYNISEKTTTGTLNSTDNNERIVETCTSNTDLIPNGVAASSENGECSGNMYHFRYQEEMSLAAHWKEKESQKSTFLPEREALMNIHLEPAQNSVLKKSQTIESKEHDRITYNPYSKSKSSKISTDMLDIKINQNKENVEGKSNIILYPSVYNNIQDDDENRTDECLNVTGQEAECRRNDNIVSRTNIIAKSLGKGTCILGYERNNKVSTPTTGTKISANLNTYNKTVKSSKNKAKYNAPINTKSSFYPNNCIQSDSLCERSHCINDSGASITTSWNASQKLGCHESIGNSRINIRNTNNSFTCDICQYKTSDLYKIVDHLEKNDHNQSHCTICTYIFRDNKEFKLHLKVHNEKKPFLCLECDRKYIRLSYFNKHSLNHHNEKPLTCLICKATFKFQQIFHGHMKNKQNKIKGKLYICAHCKDRIYICKQCSYSALGLKNHFTVSYSTTKSLLHTHVCNIDQFKCSDCNYQTTKYFLYKRHVRKWHNQIKKSLNNPVYNIRNSVITLPTANNSSQLTGKNDAKVSERNSGVQSSIERGLLINNNSNGIDNKQVITISQHQSTYIDKNEHNLLLLMSNTEQLQNINAEEVILPINNTQETVPAHSIASNDIVLLLNIPDHENMHSLLPLVQPSAKEQLPDDFQLTSYENSASSTNLNNVEDNSCKRQQDTTYSSDSFPIYSLLSLENSGDENNIKYFVPIVLCNEELSAEADLQNITTIKNVNNIFCESTSNELVHSTNNENALITSMPNNSFNERANIMLLDQEESQSYLFGVCDPCTSDGIQDIFQMDLSAMEVTDNIE